MQAFILNSPEQARQLLNAHPQLAYALFQAMIMNNIVDSSVLQVCRYGDPADRD
jgi:cleavage stimulation factor subunit 2